MLKKNRSQPKKIVGTVFGGLLIGIPAIPLVASAQGSQVLNPCPRIYYEEPFNSTRLAPEGCPPNAATRIVQGQGTPEVTRPSARSADPYYTPRMRDRTNPPVTPPLPENRSQAVAKIMSMDGNVEVRVKNNTNAIVTYEAVGHTQRRVLQGGEETVLRLPVPVTVTFTRQDDGFVQVMPMSASQDGVLEVALDEDANPRDRNQGVLRIQKDGQVFLN
ncbi:MAG: hypothetical protein CLLPBCKN_000315 [Chroococcidiopsis cubana SAG 39.79]|uniref:Uncharacterized protein n=1 Tax=Chroococcidiopsis cubana SAG 39.79 TaxID=388085 RepID=A0AB37UFQ9_9CYAN|nr:MULTISPECIES: hypothetical protein [Chroococcidiopsis]MDZ4870927.1 hypothetical protein [Chroococcidiopsis cubana SAG 39.79]PSB62961.1 hypothetical protein C7B79_15850 [Chroococcidiopsis cubana CCALA 043]RUT10407.1 hypothetical protein DSM107010_42950 [Chroococcidiopsis cubana SAG 39.79]URD48405.1 hypothetical protein M5J74_18920 [Chroococcidiopsis sp. CCNUC1]